jgi:hypothetical protein
VATLEDSGSIVVKNLGVARTHLVVEPGLLQRQGSAVGRHDLVGIASLAIRSAEGKAWLVPPLVTALPAWAPQPGVSQRATPLGGSTVPGVRRFLDFLVGCARGDGHPVVADPGAPNSACCC